jgi:hypothetical protein
VAKVLGYIAAAIGVVTGVGTIVGWVASTESIGDVASTALGWAGVAYLVLLAVWAWQWFVQQWKSLSDKDVPPGQRYGLAAVAAVTALTLTAFVPIASQDLDGVKGLGLIGVILGALYLLLTCIKMAIDYQGAYHACDDCAERISSKARVCPHCGFRYQPPLAGSRQ